MKKNKLMRFAAAVFTMLCAAGSYIWAAEPEHNPKHETSPELMNTVSFTAAFAQSLMQEGDIDGAVLEYERCVFSSDVFNEELSLGLFNALYAGQKYSRIQYLFPILQKQADKPLQDSPLGYIAALSLEESRRWKELNVFLDGMEPSSSEVSFDMIRTSAFIKQRLFSDALTIIKKYDEIAPLQDLSRDILSFKPKKPAAAAFLSALIPGLGRLYAGQPYDGVVSFISTGILAGLAVYSFYSGGAESLQTWFFTVPAAVFYSANIYGSYTTAERWNSWSEDIFAQRAEVIRDSYAF